MKPTKILTSAGIALLAMNLLNSYIDTEINTLGAIGVLIGFALASQGITEYFFGNKNKKFTYQEIFKNLAIIVGILVGITYLLPQLTFGQNVFMKEALAFIGGR